MGGRTGTSEVTGAGNNLTVSNSSDPASLRSPRVRRQNRREKWAGRGEKKGEKEKKPHAANLNHFHFK